jgi:hypothetical protein
MIKEIFGYLKAWINGDDAELHIDKTWHFGWGEVVAITIILGLITYLIWR